MKNVILLLGLILLCHICIAQPRLGVHGGIVMSKAVETNTINQVVSNYRPGPMAGLLIGYDLGESNFALLTELNFTTKGLRFSGNQEFLGQTYATQGTSYVYYIELPVQALYYSMLGAGHFFFGAGPYVAAGFQGKTKTTFTINGESAVEDKKTEFGSGYEQMKRFDYGVNGLIGYKLGYGSYLKVYYSHGLTNLSNADGAEYYNRVFGASFGFFFGSRR